MYSNLSMLFLIFSKELCKGKETQLRGAVKLCKASQLLRSLLVKSALSVFTYSLPSWYFLLAPT
ncbi:mCG147222 [Mus musculus]|nr:mCG147222 [Mus musculus]